MKIIVGLVKAGLQRIGISKDFIHVDDCMDKPRPCLFLYKTDGGE